MNDEWIGMETAPSFVPDATCRWMDTLKQLLELIRFPPLTSCHLLWHRRDQNWRIRIWNGACAARKSGHKSTSGPRTATVGRSIKNGQWSRAKGGTGLISAAPGESTLAEFWDLIAFSDYVVLFTSKFNVFFFIETEAEYWGWLICSFLTKRLQRLRVSKSSVIS